MYIDWPIALLCIFASASLAAQPCKPTAKPTPAAQITETCKPAMQDLTLMMSWKNIQWPSEPSDNHTLNSYSEPYNASAVIPTRMQMWGTQAFLTFPRYRPGIPFSLGYVLLTSSNKFDTELYAFPSWLEHTKDTYASIVNAVDIYVDHNNSMLWVLDTGEINTLQKPQRIAPPRIFGIHVTDKKVAKVIDLSDMLCPESRLQFLVADVTDESSTNLFVSDAGTRSLLVYNGAMNSDSHGFRVQLPPLVCLKSAGCKQDILHLLVASDLCRPCELRERLYFSYLSGDYMFSASTRDLSQGKTFASVEQVGRKPMKMMFVGTDQDSSLYFREQDNNVIYSWDVSTEFHRNNFVLRDTPGSCRQATSVTAGYKRLIWALESNIWDYLYGSVGGMGAGAWIRPLTKIW